MLPNGWKLTTLGKVCEGELQTGPFGSQLHAYEYQEAGVPVLMPKDIINCRADMSNAAKISKQRADDLRKHRLLAGDLLFSRRGDVARFALIDERTEGSICGTGCLKARPSKNHSPIFLSYILQKNTVKTWLEQNAVGQTMPNMNTAILTELPLISASSREEEDKIAQILSTWDKAIEKLAALIAAKQKRKKALMQQLLTGKKRFAEFVKSDGMQKTKFGTIPTDWQYLHIAEVAKQLSVKNHAGHDLPVLSCTKHYGLVDSLAYFGRQIFSEDTSTYKVAPRNTFAYATNHIEEGSIGYQNLYDEALISPMYTVFQTEQNINDEFLYRLLKTELYRHIFEVNTSASVDRRGSLRWNQFAGIKIPVPSIPEQQKIASFFAVTDKEIENHQKQLTALKQQKKALMQQLLTGKKRVRV